MAARFTANHQPPQGYRRSSGQDEVREATDPEFDVAIYFDTSTTCTAWRPRGLPPNRQPPNNTGPHYGPPAPPASMPSADSFQGPPRSFGPPRFSGTPRSPGPSGCSGPSGFRQPRPHLAECWECENRGCHSDFHQQNGTAPRSSGPPSPRLGFGNRGRRQGCWVCSRYGCHTVIEPRGSESKSTAEIFFCSATYWSFVKLDPESDTGQPVSVPAASPAVPSVKRLTADRPPVDSTPTQDGPRTETATRAVLAQKF